ncbi:MAG: PIN domain-containing protein [Actinomycetaceae bacterium]|nr:PIN domain-containing protein [Actinomycetaceae bacterium]
MTRVFVDTNVLAYLFDGRSPKKQARAQEILLSGNPLVVSTQVMLELYSVITRKFNPPLSPADGEKVLANLRQWEVINTDADLVVSAARTVTQHQLSIWDAMILEAANISGCLELWSEDLTHGSTLRGVKIVNPFISADALE